MTNDTDRASKSLIAVHVSETDNGGEYYSVGSNDVTEIKWGETTGHMAMLQTIQVFKRGELHSEHVFSNVLGVYYGEPPTDDTKF